MIYWERCPRYEWWMFCPHLFFFGGILGHLGNQMAARFTTIGVVGFAISVALILLTYMAANALVLASSFTWHAITRSQKQD